MEPPLYPATLDVKALLVAVALSVLGIVALYAGLWWCTRERGSSRGNARGDPGKAEGVESGRMPSSAETMWGNSCASSATPINGGERRVGTIDRGMKKRASTARLGTLGTCASVLSWFPTPTAGMNLKRLRSRRARAKRARARLSRSRTARSRRGQCYSRSEQSLEASPPACISRRSPLPHVQGRSRSVAGEEILSAGSGFGKEMRSLPGCDGGCGGGAVGLLKGEGIWGAGSSRTQSGERHLFGLHMLQRATTLRLDRALSAYARDYNLVIDPSN
ncbi:hypothetical protein cyc_02927 [Cyclospora cayetanensis]|uniref:Uncharacterized protein n=1 Tax=Cyclospora cayetanensis TaxID=88456 RepID=A0A1D3D7N4_9EIME|nr:hypothetical protein cyc_02927 [Cyclospora cayetanensis]